jgi:hypothetical protein
MNVPWLKLIVTCHFNLDASDKLIRMLFLVSVSSVNKPKQE